MATESEPRGNSNMTNAGEFDFESQSSLEMISSNIESQWLTFLASTSKLSDELHSLDREVQMIKQRNKEKDEGKGFEGSWIRVVFIMGITYLTLYWYMTYLGTPNPRLNALVPTIGFNISTWSLPYLKHVWIKIERIRRDHASKCACIRFRH